MFCGNGWLRGVVNGLLCFFIEFGGRLILRDFERGGYCRKEEMPPLRHSFYRARVV